MNQKCDWCKFEWPFAGGAVRARDKFLSRTGYAYYCPQCWVSKQRWVLKISLAIVLGLEALAVVAIFTPPFALYGWFPTAILLVVASYLLSIIIHEAGHAFCAWLVGFRVFGIQIGGGSTFYQTRIGKTVVEFKMGLGEGLAICAPPDTKFLRLKSFLTTLGGPLVNTAMLAIALWVYAPKRFIDEGQPLWLVLGGAFILGDAPIVALSLFPCIHCIGGHKGPSDGLTLLLIPFLPKPNSTDLRIAYLVQEGAESLKYNDFEQASRWFEQAVACLPEDPMIPLHIGGLWLNAKKFCQARQLWSDTFARAALAADFHCLLLNNLAVATLLQSAEFLPSCDLASCPNFASSCQHVENVEFLQEADRFSQEAFQTFPEVPHYRGTRGCVLVEQGRLAEGLELLESALEKHWTPQDKAFCACYVALAKGKQGHKEESNHYLEAARRLDPTCIALDAAEKRLGAAGPEKGPAYSSSWTG